MAQVGSLRVCNSLDLADELHAIVKRATRGEGIEVPRVKRFLDNDRISDAAKGRKQDEYYALVADLRAQREAAVAQQPEPPEPPPD